jgi:hypothetical protein
MPYKITFVVDTFSGVSDRAVSHQDLQILLEALTAIDVKWLLAHPETPNLYESGIRYEEEPLGEENWLDIPTALKQRRHVDCEDLSCWRAAELRVRHGIDAHATFIRKNMPSGSSLYHIQVRYPDGRIEDPSRILGMK